MKDLSTIELLKIFYTKKEIAFINKKGRVCFTNNENMCEKFDCFFTSDFETMFEIKGLLINRCNSNLNRYYSGLLKRIKDGL